MSDSKRQNLPSGLWPGLWIVATPIGNLGDFTLRAKLGLESADWILCEDTRRTSVLLKALDLQTSGLKLRRLDAHTESHQVMGWLKELQAGRNLALVTDAGTPSLSDPGAVLVHEAQRAGIRVTPLPGASAVTTLLSVSGVSETPFTFLGFFPRKKAEQKEILKLVLQSKISRVFLWFESPLRIVESLQLIAEVDPDVQLVVGKELTKFHERIFYGTADQVSEEVQKDVTAVGELGEWCFILRTSDKQVHTQECSHLELPNTGWTHALECLFLAGVSVSESSKWVSQQFCIPKKILYKNALRIFEKKST